MKLGLCTWSYHKSLETKKIDFIKLLHITAEELKLGGIDIIADHLPKADKKSLVEYKKLATDLGLTICCLSPGNNFGKAGVQERRQEVEAIKKWIDAGYILGAPCLRIFSGWPEPYQDKEKLWPEMAACIRECAGYAAEAGITLAIEPHNHGGFLATAVETLRLLKELDSPWAQLNLDTGNYQDKDNYKAIEDTMPYARHMHAKVHHISGQARELVFDFDKVFSIIKKANYRGFLSLEFEGQDFFGQDEFRHIPLSVKMLKDYAAKYAF